ncbi:hypothetical protein ACLD43_01205 [Clostridium botulinum]|uniref:hypothetical protein n=1 Tax=Clostridium botulinum TaxID=1491 RepID=UPI003A8022A2
MFVSEFLGILALTIVMGWRSYKTAKTNLAISIEIGINIFYIIFDSFIKMPGKLSQVILNMFPIASSQVISQVSGFHFDIGVWRPYEVMISMLLVFIIFGMLLSYGIYKDEIK